MRPSLIEMHTPESRLSLAAAVLLLAIAASMPGWADSSLTRWIIELCVFLIMAQMWNLMAGFGGMVSIGQQAFIGIGGYTTVVLTQNFGVNPFLCIFLAAPVAALFAYPMSFVAFRLKGGYFAIGTWALAEILRLLVANISALGGGSGTSLTALKAFSKSTRESITLWVALTATCLVFAGVYLLLRSRLGLALSAIRDSEAAAASQGVEVGRIKRLVYLLSAAGFGLAGALYFVVLLRISPDAAFGVHWSPVLIFIVMIGGLGSIEGPLLGALVYFIAAKWVGDFGTWYMVGLGATAILMVARFPGGLWGIITSRFDLRCFPVQRKLRALPPSEPVAAPRAPAPEIGSHPI